MSQNKNLDKVRESSQIQLRRSNRLRQPSTRYNFDEYVILTDERELKYFQETFESDENKKIVRCNAWWEKMIACIWQKIKYNFIKILNIFIKYFSIKYTL